MLGKSYYSLVGLIIVAMLDGNFAANFPLKHMQKDMRLAIHMGDVCDQPLHVSAAANEVRDSIYLQITERSPYALG